MRDQETETALEEAEIRNLELELQKKMFEQVIFQVYFNYVIILVIL